VNYGLHTTIELLERCRELEAENKRLREALNQRCDGVDCDKGEECVRLVKENKRLREALVDYGQHTVQCASRLRVECDCGFEALLKEEP